MYVRQENSNRHELVEPMHDRMPVIIPAKDYDRWMKATPDRLPIVGSPSTFL
jgi:putative SOS response-associated peptidase YedK